VHLAHQRARRVDDPQAARGAVGVHLGATPCAERMIVAPTGTSARWRRRSRHGGEGLDDVAVVHDLART